MKHPTAHLPQLSHQSELIDTHCHLDMETYRSDLSTVIHSAVQFGIKRIITIGIDDNSSRQAVTIAEQYANIYATVGIHPHDALKATTKALEDLTELTQNESVVGYGEIGLDYAKNYAPRDIQIKAFREQLYLAKELNLPVVIHDREAHEDTLNLIRSTGHLPRGGVMHCFSGDSRLAHEMIALGFHISIPGVATFNNAHLLHEVIRVIDLQYLLLETDGPFLAPVPYRGKRNEPKLLLYTAQRVADLKQISVDEVARATTANAVRLFRLPGNTNHDLR